MTTSTELIERLKLGASISRSRGINLDFAAIADKAADSLEAQAKQIEMLTAELGDLPEAQADMLSEIKALQADADMFWNNDDAERQYSSIEEFINDEICNGSLEVGCVFTMQRGKSLPNLTIKITSIDENECEGEYQIIDAARKQGGA